MEIVLNLDVNDMSRMIEFWCAALEYEQIGAADQYVALRPVSGAGPKLLLQTVPETKAAKNRLHLDLDYPTGFDIDSEAARMESLGARRVGTGRLSDGDGSWIVMADPEGNEFCVCVPEQP